MLTVYEENGPFRGVAEKLVYPFGTRDAQRVDDLDDGRLALAGLSAKAL
jgi:hypothetical protein